MFDLCAVPTEPASLLPVMLTMAQAEREAAPLAVRVNPAMSYPPGSLTRNVNRPRRARSAPWFRYDGRTAQSPNAAQAAGDAGRLPPSPSATAWP